MPFGASNVDERVVEMRINNREFESGAKSTIKILEKLNKSLNFKSSAQGMDELAGSFNRFNTGKMNDTIDDTSRHFDALGIMGAQVIRRLTDAVYNFVSTTAKELTLGQIEAGWDKYERMAESTQMIMAATQDEFDDDAAHMYAVNEQLEKLLWYTDETSYSLTDMTDNVGKFLNAGVGLRSSVEAMMGIASWGASAGAKTQEVSRAMYNISQAMGTGAMTLMDWKSIENANMATLEFKENVLETAAAMGKLVEVEGGYILAEKADNYEDDDIITATNFRESLNEKWFDTDVMEKVFSSYGKFADKLHEAHESTELEATELLEALDIYREGLPEEMSEWPAELQEIANNTNGGAKALLKALKELDSLGVEYSETGFRMGQEAKTFTDAIEATKDAVSSQWFKTYQYIFGDYLEAKDLWTNVTGELWEIFASGGAERNAILSYWKSFTDEVTGENGRDALLHAFANIYASIKNILSPISNVIRSVFSLGDSYKEAGERLFNMTLRFRDFTERFMVTEETAEKIEAVLTGAIDAVKGFLAPIGDFVRYMISGVHSLEDVPGVLLGTVTPFKVFGKWFAISNDRIAAFRNLLGKLDDVPFVGRLIRSFGSLDKLTPKLQVLGEYLTETKDRAVDFFWSTVEWAQNGGPLELLTQAEDVIFTILGYIRRGGGWVAGLGRSVINFFKDIHSLEDLRQKLIGLFDQIRSFDPRSAFAWFGDILDRLRNSEKLQPVAEFFSRAGEWFRSIKINGQALLPILEKIGGFITSLFSGVNFDAEGFKTAIKTLLSNALVAVREFLGQFTFRDILSGLRLGLLAYVGIQVASFVSSLKNTVNEIKTIPEGIKDILGSVNDISKATARSIQANMILKTAVAIGILAFALAKLSKIPEDQLVSTAVVLGILLGLLAIIAKNMKTLKTTNIGNNSPVINVLPKLAGNLIGFALAIAAIGFALGNIAKIGDTKVLWQSVGALMIVIAGMAVAIGVLSHVLNGSSVPKSFGILITFASVILSISKALKAAGKSGFNGGEILLILVGFAAIVASMSLLVKMAQGTNFAILGGLAVAFLALSVGILALIPSLMAMRLVKVGSILKFALVIGILVGALSLLSIVGSKNYFGLTGMVEAILKIALACGVFSLAMLAVGAAIAIATPGILALGSAFLGLFASIKSKSIWQLGDMALKLAFLQIACVLTGVALAILGVGMGVIAVAVGILAIGFIGIAFAASILAAVLVPLGEAWVTFTDIVANGQLDWKIALVVIAIIGVVAAIALLMSKAKLLPKLIELVSTVGSGIFDIVGKIIDGAAGILSTKGFKIAAAAVMILILIARAINAMSPELLGELTTLLGNVLEHLLGLMGYLTSVLIVAVINVLNGIANGLSANRGQVSAAINRIFGEILAVVAQTLGDMAVSFVNMIVRAIIEAIAGLGHIEFDLLGKHHEIDLFDADKLLSDWDTTVGGMRDKFATGAQHIADSWKTNDPVDPIVLSAEDSFEKLGETVKRGLPESESGFSLEGLLGGLFSDAESEANGMFSFLPDAASAETEDMAASGSSLATSLLQGFFGGEDDGEGGSFGDQFSTLLGEGLDFGFLEGEGSVDGGMNELMGLISGKSQDFYDSAYSTASFVPAGAAQSIYDNAYQYQDALDWMANLGIGQFATTNDSHSPSRVFYWLAHWVPVAAANAVMDGSGEYADAVDMMAQNGIDEMKRAMSQIAMVADENYDLQPTIAPIVDMSGVTRAAGSINELMRGGTYSFGANVPRFDGNNIRYSMNNRDVVNAIESLNERMENMADAIANMQIVLDSGAVVGGTAAKMDKRLGTLSVRKGRA